jgi:hypothetical protein
MTTDKDKVEEIPIEEFENDKQDLHKQFLTKFGDKKEDKESVEKSIEDDILTKKDYTQWL